MIKERIRTEEQQRSYSDLVDLIAIRADHEAVAFRRTRSRIDELRRWFIHHTGWPVVETRDLIRLVKTPASFDASHGLRWCERPLDYELFVWMLHYEESRESPQFVCSELVRDLEADVRGTIGPDHFSWSNSVNRRSLARVVGAMMDMGALRRLDGSIEAFVVDDDRDGLYEFTGLARHLYVRVPHDLDAADDPLAAVREAAMANPAAPLQRLYRALLLQPALREAEDPEAFALLQRSEVRQDVARQVRDHFGWDLELTSSYAALLRPAAHHSRNAFPRAQASILHVVLLMCGAMRLRVQRGLAQPDASDSFTISRSQFLSELAAVREEYGANWGKRLQPDVVTIGELATETIRTMQEWALAEPLPDGEQIRILPLAARFVAAYTTDAIASFDTEDDPDE